MSHSKFRFKALGLCLVVVLGVMAAVAAGAQAKGHWFVTLTHTLEVGAAEEDNDFLLLSTFGIGTIIEVLCTKIKVDDGLLFEDGSGLGEILFSNCQTMVKKVVTANCKPLEPVIAKVKNLLIHHKEDTYILFSPHDGLTFATVHVGALCAAGTNIQVKGNAVAECGLLSESSWTHEDCSNEKLTHEFRPASTELFPTDTLKFGANVATAHGDAKLSLVGLYAGMKWGALATL